MAHHKQQFAAIWTAVVKGAVGVTVRDLKRNVLDPSILIKHCSLGRGNQVTSTRQALDSGGLGTFPLEVQHSVVGFLDVKTLLAFRRVNKQAMMIVDSHQEFSKIMSHEGAANTIRLAVGLGCVHQFTIMELFEKLCQRHCDNCGKLAAYIDVFNLARRCLDVGGECKPYHVPQLRARIKSVYGLSEAQIDGLPSIYSMAGEYGVWNSFTHTVPATYYDGEAASSISDRVNSIDDIPYQAHARLTVTFAEFLNTNDTGAEDVCFCMFCKEEVLTRTQVVRMPDDFRSGMGIAALFPWTPMPEGPPSNPCPATLCTTKTIAEHVYYVHGDGKGKTVKK